MNDAYINPWIPMSDQDRIFRYNINKKINQIAEENKDKYQFGDN